MSLSYGYHMGMLWLSYGIGLTMGHVWGVIGTGMDLEWSGKGKWAEWKGGGDGVRAGLQNAKIWREREKYTNKIWKCQKKVVTLHDFK